MFAPHVMPATSASTHWQSCLLTLPLWAATAAIKPLRPATSFARNANVASCELSEPSSLCAAALTHAKVTPCTERECQQHHLRHDPCSCTLSPARRRLTHFWLIHPRSQGGACAQAQQPALQAPAWAHVITQAVLTTPACPASAGLGHAPSPAPQQLCARTEAGQSPLASIKTLDPCAKPP